MYFPFVERAYIYIGKWRNDRPHHFQNDVKKRDRAVYNWKVLLQYRQRAPGMHDTSHCADSLEIIYS